jgi:glycosyltransferase involved in cell wall biosynthesis
MPAAYRSGVTVLTVNWNSLPFLRGMLAATRSCSPSGTEILVIDNGSSDGSLAYLRGRSDVRTMRLPINVGHGVALDLAVPTIDTEFVAVLDIDAFPISDRWLEASIASLERDAVVAGARMHRNYVHPCFLVARTSTLHSLDLTFRPVGSLASLPRRAPLFLDVGEALSQRVIVRFGGGQALHFFEPTSVRGPGNTGTVYGDLVYHNQYATQGEHRDGALQVFVSALDDHHPGVKAT